LEHSWLKDKLASFFLKGCGASKYFLSNIQH